MTRGAATNTFAGNDPADTFACCWLRSIDEIDANEWDALEGDGNPFLQHAFLAALEHQGCVGPDTGWIPQHLVLYRQGRLQAAMPGYLKLHSYGEFVFDWAWAEASERAGWPYYPKLVSAIPYTPVTGPRFLLAQQKTPRDCVQQLLMACVERAQQQPLSSSHWLFTPGKDDELIRAEHFLERWGCQFHWYNQNYRDFDDYLQALTSKRRKQIRKERREAAAAPVDIVLRHGAELSAEELQAYHTLYCSTYDRKWGFPALSLEFFQELAVQMPQQLILILARRAGKIVAGAHFLRGENCLYGRNWGCSEYHSNVHFEMCYYRGIEYCIDNGLAVFEAGAQGEHKLFRGFKPVKTRSYHWIRELELRRAIAEFLHHERADITQYIQHMSAHEPYRTRD